MRSRIINILGNIPIWVMILLFPTLLSLGLFQPTDHYTGSSRLFIALSIIFTLVISCISVALDEEFNTLQEKEKVKNFRLGNKKKLNSILSTNIEDANETFIEELKKLEND